MSTPAGWFQIDNAALDRASEVGPSAFLVYAALCRHANRERRCWPSVERVAGYLGTTRKTVCRAIQRLEAVGWVVTKRHGYRNRNEYHLPPIASRDTGVPTPKVELGHLRKELGHLRPRVGTLVSQEQDLEQDHKNKTNSLRKKTKTKTSRFSSEDLKTAKWMFGLVQALDSKAKKPNLDKWAETIRLTRKQDGRTDAEIRAVFQWANQDSFWRSNILSPAKLRDKFSQLKLKMKGSQNGRSQHTLGPGQRYTPGATVEPL